MDQQKYSHDISRVRDIEKWLRSHLCSDCWEALVEDKETETVTCVTEGCACNGIVHVKTVRIREEESKVLLHEAQLSLSWAGFDVPGYKKPVIPESASEILKQLGF